MKKKTLLYLNSFIQNKLYNEYVNRPFIALFKNYIDKEIKNINDFIMAAKAFVKFITLNKKQILTASENLTEAELNSDLNEIASVVNRLMDSEQSVNQNNFVNMVEYFINRCSRVLDVGAGGLPVSSIKLAKRNDNVSSIDNFIVSEQFLKNNNVNSMNGYFNESTDVSMFDMVVGSKPCNAIGQIVETCKRENKPYLLYLCECGAFEYGMKLKMFESDWSFILPKIDPDVKIVNRFATNIDIPAERLKKVIYKKCKLTKEMQECGAISFMEVFSNAMREFSIDMTKEKTIITPSGVVSISKADVKGEWVIDDSETSLDKE